MKTHCPQGHPYDEANTYITGTGRRQCRTCKALNGKRSVQNQRTFVAGWRDQRCPLCGEGWFVNAGVHVKKIHGVTMRGLVAESFSFNQRIISDESGFSSRRRSRSDYWGRWAKTAVAEMAVGGFYVERLAERWRLTRQGASSRLMRLEERGLIERPRPRNRSLRSEKDQPSHCRHGHKLTPENIRIQKSTGTRQCRACLKAQAHAAYERRKARGYYVDRPRK